MDVSRMRSVTYGDTKPIANNATEQGREKQTAKHCD